MQYAARPLSAGVKMGFGNVQTWAAPVRHIKPSKKSQKNKASHLTKKELRYQIQHLSSRAIERLLSMGIHIFAKSPQVIATRLSFMVGRGASTPSRRKAIELFTDFLEGRVQIVCKSAAPRTKPPVVREGFYWTNEWREIRYRRLKESDGKCGCCGRGRKEGAVLHVDHIKPRSKYPELELVYENTQVLCDDCNLGKSNRDETDWRR